MSVHVIGAGLAGLAAAVRLTAAGRRVALYEAAPQAGGRCRSYQDDTLGQVIDNGNHLMMSGNGSLMAYLDQIGATDSLMGPKDALYPFADLKTGKRWTVHVADGAWSHWLQDPTRNVPGAGLFSRLGGLRLLLAGENATVAGCLRGTGGLWSRFWEPLATSVLNTPPEKASARLLLACLRESFAKGGHNCRPLVARDSLAASLVDPALAFLSKNRTDLFFGQRLRALDLTRHVHSLHFAGLNVTLEPGEQVILALPPAQIAELVPGVRTPRGAHAIVNAHFRLSNHVPTSARSTLLGIVGGQAQWLFLRDEVVSVTVSAADALARENADVIAGILWSEIALLLDQPFDPLPPFRVIKEKRATFSQTPEQIGKRPATKTRWPNLHLAGDWTDTGLPATIEGAIRSGDHAAEAALAQTPGRRGR